MSSIKNIALVGASGALGKPVLTALTNSGLFNITIIRRKGSSSTFPSNLKTVEVDLTSVPDLTAVLKGQDAVVSTVASLQIDAQYPIIDAAIAAGVQRFIPSEFGSNLDIPKTRALPVFKHKVDVQDYIIAKARAGEISYTFVYNGAFLDWGIEQGFLLSPKPPTTWIEGGKSAFSATSLATVGEAVVGILKHPEQTKNRAVYIEDIKLSQQKMLDLAKRAAPEKKWEFQETTLDEMTAASDQKLAKGQLGFDTFIPYLFRAIMDPECKGNFEKTDNELFGLKGKTEEDVVEMFKKHLN